MQHNVVIMNIGPGINVTDLAGETPYKTGQPSLNATIMASSEVNRCVTFNFVFYTIVIGGLNVLGLVGNILSILVLQRDKGNQVATFLLQSLALADCIVLCISYVFLSTIYGLLPYLDLSEYVANVIPYVVKYVHPIGYMGQCATIWITVLLAVNRYIAIVKPFLTPSLCTINKARLQVAFVLILAFLFNFPRFFQYEIVHNFSHEGINVTALDETSIGENTLFGMIYTNIVYSVIILVVPLFILSVLNTCLILELKLPRCRQGSSVNSTSSNKTSPAKSSKKSSSSLAGKRRHSSTPPLPEEENITAIMVSIILVFLCCHTPDRITHIYRYFFTPLMQPMCGEVLYYVLSACNLLIVVNSSTNFIIYYLLRKRFRKILLRKLCAWSNFKRYKEPPPSYLEQPGLDQPRKGDLPAPLVRRHTDSVMVVQDVNGHHHEIIKPNDMADSVGKVGSAPTLC